MYPHTCKHSLLLLSYIHEYFTLQTCVNSIQSQHLVLPLQLLLLLLISERAEF